MAFLDHRVHTTRPALSGRPAAVALVTLSIAACNVGGTDPGPLAEGGHHVLFIGNSLTYTNDLPRTVADLAASVGDTIRVRSEAYPNYAVIDHVYGGSDAVSLIRNEPWDYVVLQQGPTPAGLDRDTLVLAAELLDPLVRQAGGRTVALMTWPSASQQVQYPNLFDQTRDTCRLAAAAVSGLCWEAGEAWRRAWDVDGTLPLYANDGFHPSRLGTWLAALVVYESVTGHDARLLSVAGGTALGLSEHTVRMLQQVAHETVAAQGATVRPDRR